MRKNLTIAALCGILIAGMTQAGEPRHASASAGKKSESLVNGRLELVMQRVAAYRNTHGVMPPFPKEPTSLAQLVGCPETVTELYSGNGCTGFREWNGIQFVP